MLTSHSDSLASSIETILLSSNADPAPKSKNKFQDHVLLILAKAAKELLELHAGQREGVCADKNTVTAGNLMPAATSQTAPVLSPPFGFASSTSSPWPPFRQLQTETECFGLPPSSKEKYSDVSWASVGERNVSTSRPALSSTSENQLHAKQRIVETTSDNATSQSLSNHVNNASSEGATHAKQITTIKSSSSKKTVMRSTPSTTPSVIAHSSSEHGYRIKAHYTLKANWFAGSERLRSQARVATGGSRDTDACTATTRAYDQLVSQLDGKRLSLMVAAFTCTHNAELVAGQLHELAPDVPMLGCTSCRGVFLNAAWLSQDKEFAVGLWGISDVDGYYSVVHIQDRQHQLYQSIFTGVTDAIKKRGREEKPSFALLLGAPGDEEIILHGLEAALGKGVPILGGSAGDNHVLGKWMQIAKVGSSSTADALALPTTSQAGISIAIGWSSCQVVACLTSGFQKTTCEGTVTKVSGSDHGRTILEIDGLPVKQVYETWTEGSVTRDVRWTDGVANVLAPSSFCPLGEPRGDYTRVIHPAFLNARSGALTSFANAHEGMRIVMLQSTPEELTKRISHNALDFLKQAESLGATSKEDCIGALNIFCGGLVMAIEDRLALAAEHLAEIVGHRNSMGICCFGEQGIDTNMQFTHGNLMFGYMVFTNVSRLSSGASSDLLTSSVANEKAAEFFESIRRDRADAHQASSKPSSTEVEWRCGLLVLSPHSSVRLIWDTLIVSFLIYDLIMAPIETLVLDGQEVVPQMALVSVVFWTIDMFMSSITAFYSPHGLVSDHRTILIQYSRSWFLIDATLLACEWLRLLVSRNSWLRIVGPLRLIRFVRLLRAFKLHGLLLKVQRELHSVLASMCIVALEVFLGLLAVVHMMACVWYNMGISNTDSWLTAMQIEIVRSFSWSNYALALHWAVCQFHGSMEVEPHTVYERVFTICTTLCAFMGASALVGFLTDYLIRLQGQYQEISEHRAYLNKLLSMHPVSRGTSMRATLCLERYYRKRQELQEKATLDLLPTSVRTDVYAEMFTTSLCRHSLFKYLHLSHPGLFRHICDTTITQSDIAASFMVVSAGDICGCAFYLEEGRVQHEMSDLPNKARSTASSRSLTGSWLFDRVGTDRSSAETDRSSADGSSSTTLLRKVVPRRRWLCEGALWSVHWQATGSLRALSYCRFLKLEGGALDETVQKYPDALIHVALYANHFVNRMQDLEDNLY